MRPYDAPNLLRLADQSFDNIQWCEVRTHSARYRASHHPHVKAKIETIAIGVEVRSAYLDQVDKDWIKKRLRLQGKTSADLAAAIGRDRAVVSRIMNGHQALTLEQAKVFAVELGVEVSEILHRTGMTDAPTAQVFSPGFSDSDAMPFLYTPGMAETSQVRSLAAAFGERPGVDVWRVKGRAMVLAGFLEGDFILVDTHQAERVRAGDVVIAQIYTRNGANTVLRRYEPPVLVAATADPIEARVHVVDGVNVVIRGKVVASWRVS